MKAAAKIITVALFILSLLATLYFLAEGPRGIALATGGIALVLAFFVRKDIQGLSK